MPTNGTNTSPQLAFGDESDPDAWDPDTAPPWTKDDFALAEWRRGDVVVKPTGVRPSAAARRAFSQPKRQVTLRIDSDVLDRFRAGGPGWQTRINEALRKATI